MQDLRIRIITYTEEYFDALIAILRQNTPSYFSAEEEPDFSRYLSSEVEDYYVVLANDILIGGGGINYSPETCEAVISWDMIHPEYQEKSIGTQLLKHRLNRIQDNKTFAKVIVRTSQFTYQFYQKHGFELLYIKKDYWDKGFDLYFMAKQLNE